MTASVAVLSGNFALKVKGHLLKSGNILVRDYACIGHSVLAPRRYAPSNEEPNDN